jgi:hypothetical protein
MRPSCRASLLLCVLGGSLSLGCAPTVRGAVKGATEGATSAALESLQEPATRRRVLEVIDSPEMQQTIREVARSVTAGATDAMLSDKTDKRSEQLAKGIAVMVTRAAVDAALAETTTPRNEARIQELSTLVAEHAVNAAMGAAAERLPQTVGPAVARMVRQDVGSNLRGLANDPELRAAMASVAFEISRQMVFGSNEAMAELEQKKGSKGLLARVSSLLAESGVVLLVILVLLLGTIGTLVVFLQRARGEARRYKVERDVTKDVRDDLERASYVEPPRRAS